MLSEQVPEFPVRLPVILRLLLALDLPGLVLLMELSLREPPRVRYHPHELDVSRVVHAHALYVLVFRGLEGFVIDDP